ncbi:MAG: SPOR domain-containing protein, partial [Deltaproteobacteria bacterium]|nr:SPOR domain-containing protein [Deltaproteobacteria bacterium]
KKAPLEALQVKEGQATQRTEELLSRARQELEMEEGVTAAKPKSPVRTPAAPTRPVASERTPVAPMASATQAPPRESGLFTVQVFSSQSKERAQELVTRLKQQGYAAYLSSFESSGRQIWYRVRVGKTSREEADAMANKLINEENLKSTQVLKL